MNIFIMRRYFENFGALTTRTFNENTGRRGNKFNSSRRLWLWRCWCASTFLAIIFSHAQVGKADAAGNTTLNGVSTLEFSIFQISSPLGMETLTGVSGDQCKLWGDGGALTWLFESRLLVFSISNIYESKDATSSAGYYSEMQYTPSSLSFARVDLVDSEGLSFHLSLNATPLCGSTKLPTKVLCNENSAVPVDKKRNATSMVTRSLCGGHYFLTYRYAYACLDGLTTPPSCKTSCGKTDNETHCFTCDERDGGRRCCPGAAQPECRKIGGNERVLSQSTTPSTTFQNEYVIAIVVLGVVCAILLLLCMVFSRLLLIERSRRRRQIDDSNDHQKSNGWLKQVPALPKKNGTVVRFNGVSPPTTSERPATDVANGHEHTVIVKNGHVRTSNDYADNVRHSISEQPPHGIPFSYDFQAVKNELQAAILANGHRRPASCEPVANGRRRQRLDVESLYKNQNGRVPSVALRNSMSNGRPNTATPDMAKSSNYNRNRDLGTLF